MNILVTGTSGYAGFEIYKFLINTSHKIFSVDLFENKKITSNQFIFNLSYIDKFKNLDHIKFDICIHTAGLFNNKKNIENSISADKNIISYCKKNNIKLIYFSTFLIKTFPNIDYAKLKKNSENLIQESKIEYIILRPETIYSKHEKKIKFYQKFKLFNCTISFPRKNVLRSPTHIKDICEIINKIIFENKFSNKIFELGGGPITYEDILKICNKNDLTVFNIPTFIKFFLKNILYIKFGKPIVDSQDYDRVSETSEVEKELNFSFRNFNIDE
jgi:nucleoside-diphosphate-sugar epimerase